MDPVEVRLRCMELAQRIWPKAEHPAGFMDTARTLATEAWAGMAPVERTPTPLSTVEECADAMAALLEEMVRGNPDLGPKLEPAKASWNRFMADVTQAIGNPDER